MAAIFSFLKRAVRFVSGKAQPVSVSNESIKPAHNQVYSDRVSTRSLQGNFIEIRENSTVDEFCVIGSYTYIGTNTSVTRTNIGRYCSIGNNVSIGPGEHDLNEISTSACFYENPYEQLTQKNCTIGSDVWIGADSIIKRGVNIGDGAVVGANSFVNKDVPPYAIVAGNPAKLIRHRFNEKAVALLLASQWWLHDLEKAKLLHAELKVQLAAIDKT